MFLCILLILCFGLFQFRYGYYTIMMINILQIPSANIFRTKILFSPVYPRNPYSTLISRIASGSAFARNFLVFKPIALRSHGRYRKSSGAIMQLFNPITTVNYRLVAFSKAWTKKEEVDTFL